MTRDTYQHSGYTAVVLISNLDHYFTATVSVIPIVGFSNDTKFPRHYPFKGSSVYSAEELQ